MAGYHQYHAVNKAVAETVKATAPESDKKVGIIWHTQRSGKSLSMAFYAGKIIQHPAMANPTLIVLTDRNDLDEQLFTTFSKCHELLRQKPIQAADRADLKTSSTSLPVVSSSPLFRNLPQRNPVANTKSSPLAATLSSLLTKPTVLNTGYRHESSKPKTKKRGKKGHTPPMVSPNTCAMPCPMPPSSALPEPRSKPPTRTPNKSLATTSTSTTSNGQ